MEKSFLNRKLYNFSKNVRKTERKLKKYYPAIMSSKVERGKMLETAMVLRLDAEFFWRDVYKNEVDIVLNHDKVVPVEVKSGKVEIRGLLRFMEKFKVKKGFVVSLKEEKKIKQKGKLIEVIPAWKFLLEENKLRNI